MSERLKSQYLRKREEISSHPGRYFFAGFMFSFFLLFLFYQFRSMILHPTSACEEKAKTQKTIENEPNVDASESASTSKSNNYSAIISDIEINQKDIKEIQLDADKLISNDQQIKQARKSTGRLVNTENKQFITGCDNNSKEMTGKKGELN